MLKEVLCREIENTPALKDKTAEVIGNLYLISINKHGVRELCGYNADATSVEEAIFTPAWTPQGAHYWHGITCAIATCKTCPALEMCNGNVVKIKRHNEIKCVMLK